MDLYGILTSYFTNGGKCMANKKAASTKKSAVKAPAAPKQTTTKVTTVKAVDARPAEKAARSRRLPFIGRLNRMPLVVSAIAEFIGTFMLASVIVTQQGQPIALFFALIGIVLIIGGLSGAHVNPAMTIGAWVTRRMNATRAVTYLVAQVLGAMLAFVVLSAFVGQAPEVSDQAAMFGQTAPELFKAAALPEGKEWTVLFAELIGATILAFAYASAMREGREKIVAAFTVASGIFLALIIAGTAATYVQANVILNPAAAIALEAFRDLTVWSFAIYVVVTSLGGVLGFALYDLLKQVEKEA